MSEHNAHEVEDACAEFGPVQYRALVWFFSVILIGMGLTYTLRMTDLHNYMTNGEYFDNDAYRENRLSSTSVASEPMDERAHGDLPTAASKLNQK